MFFKGIKYYFLFLICLFSVNLVLKCPPSGSKGFKSSELSTAPRQASPPPRFYDFESDDETPVTTEETRKRLARLEQKKSLVRTSPSSPVGETQTVSPKKPSQLEIAINEAALRRQMKEGKQVFDQIQAAQDAQQAVYMKETQQRLRRGQDPSALSSDDYQDPSKLYETTMARKQAAETVRAARLQQQLDAVDARMSELKSYRDENGRLDLSNDELDELAGLAAEKSRLRKQQQSPLGLEDF